MNEEFIVPLISAGSGLLGVLIGASISWWQVAHFNKQSRKERAQYLAVKVAVVLNEYSDACQAVIDDDGYIKGATPKSGYPEPQKRIPAAPEYPQDVDWKSIDPKMMRELFISFPSEIKTANTRLEYIWDEVQNTPDVTSILPDRAEEYKKLQKRAQDLSQELQKIVK